MRGPGLRLDLDVRRTWRCPACGAERRTQGDVAQMRCGCSDAPLMRYVETARPRRPDPKPHDPYMDVDSIPNDSEDAYEPSESDPAPAPTVVPVNVTEAATPVGEQSEASEARQHRGRKSRKPQRERRRTEPDASPSPAPEHERPPDPPPQPAH